MYEVRTANRNCMLDCQLSVHRRWLQWSDYVAGLPRGDKIKKNIGIFQKEKDLLLCDLLGTKPRVKNSIKFSCHIQLSYKIEMLFAQLLKQECSIPPAHVFVLPAQLSPSCSIFPYLVELPRSGPRKSTDSSRSQSPVRLCLVLFILSAINKHLTNI